MEVESSICLSDLVPALRWSRPQQVAEALGDPRLPAGWWHSLTLSRALGTAGLDWICERLARLASSRWDYLPLADLLPALTVHHVDPALPGWPEATRTAITGLGGWQRLRRLSPSDLGTPSATPEVVIGSVFREILGRIPAQREAPEAQREAPAAQRVAPAADHPEVTRPLIRGTGPFPVQADPVPQTGMFAAQSGAAERPFANQGQADAAPQRPAAAADPRQTGSFPVQQPPGTGPLAAQGQDSGSGPQTGSFPAVSDRSSPASQSRQTGSFPVQPGQDGSAPPRQTGSFPAQTGSFSAQPQTGSFPAQQQGGEPRQGLAGEGLPPRPAPGQPERAPQRPAGPQAASQAGSQPGRQDDGSASGGPSTGSMPAVPGGPSTGSMPAVPGGPSTGSMPAVPGPANASKSNGTPSYPAPAPVPSAPAVPASPVPTDADHAMVRVVDNLFRSLDKLELAVAVHRLFAEDPVSLRTLAHKMLVDRDALSQAQRTAEERVLHWLRSSESAPVTGHMFRLTEWLGAAATEDQLIGADPAHPVTVPSLRTPLWRVLVTLMPDRRFQDGWLVVGDLHRLQDRTRQLLASSPSDADVVELMGELGIRAHSARAWYDALPQESSGDAVAEAPSPAQPLPRRTPGANGHHHRGGQPIPSAASAAGSIDPSAALATLSALSGGRSPMLAGTPPTPPPPLPGPSSDPRRWQRIEVTPEHLRGGPVPVPEGYAAQLGMRPGTLLSVTGPGDNAIVLVWQGHQPVFDSLQPVLMRLNARPGDQVYVTVDGYRLEAQLTA
ncbi:hypothetical protein ACIBQ1_39785 [Nonomuraea sp. NPDC050153]|uniref:hypothetical protein n=1 Tax=Nonomuraea sp. NPDC050153 TaxID=3364359 RepID=UPI0037A4F019